MEQAIILLVGLVIGFVACWFVKASRQTHLQEQLQTTERARDEALAQLREESARRGSFEALASRVPDVERELAVRESTLRQQGLTILELSRQKESLAATIEAERRAFDDKLKLLEDAKSALTDAFNALSGAALKSNSEEFLKLATVSVSPVKEALEKFEARVQSLEVAREGAYQGLVQQVSQLLDTGKELRSETSNLVQALRSPIVRGQWGDIQLRRVVEMAGMIGYCDFVQQETVDAEGGKLRPDLVVRLPAGKTIVVDAKAPVSSYMDAMAEMDEAQCKARLQAFARLVRDHVTALGRKAYWDQFERSPELVVLFLPGDHLYSAALQQDPSLIEYGVDQRVLIATPVNLIGLLRAVAYGWRQEAIATNAKEISDLGAELYKRLADLGGHWIDMRASLSRTVDAFNSAVGSLESRVLVSARRFKELGAAPSSLEIDAVDAVEKAPRALKSIERA
ncbi:MAG: DNA recombination protein RmuC [Betaproteobacteria bacterium]